MWGRRSSRLGVRTTRAVKFFGRWVWWVSSARGLHDIAAGRFADGSREEMVGEERSGCCRSTRRRGHGSRRPSRSGAFGGNPTTCVRAFVPHVSTALATLHHRRGKRALMTLQLPESSSPITSKSAPPSPRLHARGRPAPRPASLARSLDASQAAARWSCGHGFVRRSWQMSARSSDNGATSRLRRAIL